MEIIDKIYLTATAGAMALYYYVPILYNLLKKIEDGRNNSKRVMRCIGKSYNYCYKYFQKKKEQVKKLVNRARLFLAQKIKKNEYKKNDIREFNELRTQAKAYKRRKKHDNTRTSIFCKSVNAQTRVRDARTRKSTRSGLQRHSVGGAQQAGPHRQKGVQKDRTKTNNRIAGKSKGKTTAKTRAKTRATTRAVKVKKH